MIRKGLAALLLLSMGCATFDRGPMQRVFITSEPEGAEVELIRCGVADDTRTTPVTVLIPRRVKRCSILLVHDGYEPARVMLERRRAENPPYHLDVFTELCGDCTSLTDLFVAATLGGVLYGAARGVDKLAGSDYLLEPREVQVALVPLDRPLHEDP